MTTTKGARKKNRTGEGRARFRLTVEGKGYRPEALEVVYSAEEANGSSEMTIEPMPHRALQDATTKLELGYGGRGTDGLREVFRGALEVTEEGDTIAWGPFKLMAEQRFMEQVSYQGWHLDRALFDICRRAGYAPGQIEVRGLGGFELGKKARFPLQKTLGSAANGLLKSANAVSPDRPGGRVLFMPRPRPGANAKHKASFDESHYPPEGFQPKPSRRGFYSKVVVSSVLPGGEYAFPPVIVPVANRGRRRPPKNRAYVIADFKGDSSEAAKTAAELATKLERGTVPFELSGIAADPELLVFDPVECEGTEKVWGIGSDERHLVRYDCQVDRSLSFSVTREAMGMALAGSAVEKGRRVLPKPFYFARRHSPVYVP